MPDWGLLGGIGQGIQNAVGSYTTEREAQRRYQQMKEDQAIKEAELSSKGLIKDQSGAYQMTPEAVQRRAIENKQYQPLSDEEVASREKLASAGGVPLKFKGMTGYEANQQIESNKPFISNIGELAKMRAARETKGTTLQDYTKNMSQQDVASLEGLSKGSAAAQQQENELDSAIKTLNDPKVSPDTKKVLALNVAKNVLHLSDNPTKNDIGGGFLRDPDYGAFARKLQLQRDSIHGARVANEEQVKNTYSKYGLAGKIPGGQGMIAEQGNQYPPMSLNGVVHVFDPTTGKYIPQKSAPTAQNGASGSY